jgi:di/tripeptidase
MVSFTSVSSIAVALLTASSAVNAQYAPQMQQLPQFQQFQQFQQPSNFGQVGLPSAYAGQTQQYPTPQQQQQTQQPAVPQSEALNELSQTFYNWAKSTNIVNKNYQQVASEAMNDFKNAQGSVQDKLAVVNKKYHLQELAGALAPLAGKLAQEYKTNPAVQQAAASYLPKIQEMISSVTGGSGGLGAITSLLGPLKSLLG